MILIYAWRVVWRALVFFLFWTAPTFIGVGAYTSSPAAGAVAALIVYLVAYRIWPFGRCVRCDGAGKFWDPTGAYQRLCPRCGGSGRRYRVGLDEAQM